MYLGLVYVLDCPFVHFYREVNSHVDPLSTQAPQDIMWFLSVFFFHFALFSHPKTKIGVRDFGHLGYVGKVVQVEAYEPNDTSFVHKDRFR